MHAKPIARAVQQIISVASDDDLRMLEEPRAYGALIPFKSNLQYHNIIFVGCSDGHRIHLWKEHLELCRPENGGCFHPFMDHGGALRIALTYPLVEQSVALDKIRQIHLGYVEVKPGTQQIVCTAHWPCKAATLANLDIIESVTYLACAKLCIRALLPDAPPIALYYKVDTKHGETITESVWAKRFIEWLEEQSRPELEIVRMHQKMLEKLSVCK